MVERPEDYLWSSYQGNAKGIEDGLLQPHAEYLALGATQEERQNTYRDLFSTHLDMETLNELRKGVNQGLVTGGDRFTAEIETMLERRVRPAKRGRPTKQAGEHGAKVYEDYPLSFVETEK